jgi:hypothetical protein
MPGLAPALTHELAEQKIPMRHCRVWHRPAMPPASPNQENRSFSRRHPFPRRPRLKRKYLQRPESPLRDILWSLRDRI